MYKVQTLNKNTKIETTINDGDITQQSMQQLTTKQVAQVSSKSLNSFNSAHFQYPISNISIATMGDLSLAVQLFSMRAAPNRRPFKGPTFDY